MKQNKNTNDDLRFDTILIDCRQQYTANYSRSASHACRDANIRESSSRWLFFSFDWWNGRWNHRKEKQFLINHNSSESLRVLFIYFSLIPFEIDSIRKNSRFINDNSQLQLITSQLTQSKWLKMKRNIQRSIDNN